MFKAPSVVLITSPTKDALYVGGAKRVEKPNITDTDIVREIVGTVRVLRFSGAEFPYDLEDAMKHLRGSV